MIFYTYSKITVLLNYGDTIQSEIIERRDEIEELFKQEDTNFNVAFAVVKQNYWAAHEVNITGYLEWDLRYWNWSPIYDDKGTMIDQRYEILPVSSRKCTQEDRKKFYAEPEVNNFTIEDYFPFLNCFVAPEDLTLQGWLGGKSSQQGKVFSMAIRKCKGKDYCKTDDEINTFIETHRIILQYNQQTYRD